MIFCEIENLKKLESENKWKDAVNLLYNFYNKDKSAKNFIRLASECWYILSQSQFLDGVSDNDENLFRNILSELYKDFEIYFSNDSDVLTIFGYMVSLFPSYFYNDDDEKNYLLYEKQGAGMLKKATEIDKTNLLAETFYFGTQNSKQYEKSKAKLIKEFNKYIAGDTAIENYFYDVMGISQKTSEK